VLACLSSTLIKLGRFFKGSVLSEERGVLRKSVENLKYLKGLGVVLSCSIDFRCVV
jgi:hypothetical protein